MSFASTFFNPNSVIQTERKSILYCKLQVIVTLLEATNQNARAVSLPPGCICTCICTCICKCICKCICIYIYIYTHICACLNLYVYDICICMCKFICKLNVCVYVYACVSVYVDVCLNHQFIYMWTFNINYMIIYGGCVQKWAIPYLKRPLCHR